MDRQTRSVTNIFPAGCGNRVAQRHFSGTRRHFARVAAV
jgi:hypothetical protein